MEQTLQIPPNPFRTFGLWTVLTGGLGLAMVFIYMIAPMLEPQPSAGTQIGEIAGEIRRAAWAKFLGTGPAEPELQSRDYWIYLGLVGPILGIIAVILAVVSGIMGENRRFWIAGTAFGVSAIVMQFLWMATLVICGMILIAAIINNIGDIFS